MDIEGIISKWRFLFIYYNIVCVLGDRDNELIMLLNEIIILKVRFKFIVGGIVIFEVSFYNFLVCLLLFYFFLLVFINV